MHPPLYFCHRASLCLSTRKPRFPVFSIWKPHFIPLALVALDPRSCVPVPSPKRGFTVKAFLLLYVVVSIFITFL